MASLKCGKAGVLFQVEEHNNGEKESTVHGRERGEGHDVSF
jgi:hypothetical protein